MKTDKDKIYFFHILDAIDKIESVAATIDREEFENSWLLQDAVLKNFIVIGEAAAQISDEIKQQYNNVNWRGAKSMRNFIVHEYFSVDISFVWQTILDTIPEFKQQITEITDNLK